jgi:hypothetical protein
MAAETSPGARAYAPSPSAAIKRSEVFTKFLQGSSWRRVLYERLTEPLQLNLLSLPVLLFGSYRTKITFDLVIRQQNAYGLLRAADLAKQMGLGSVTVAEFGVAAGAGLFNLCKIATRVQKLTGVNFIIVGFDTGSGMPPPLDYRDHPELYQEGDFPMDRKRLLSALPPNAKLLLGPLSNTAVEFREQLTSDSPLSFVSIDVDYYSSARDALLLLSDPDPTKYLPMTVVYLDDVMFENHNEWCGELLAVNEFNDAHSLRKIGPDRFLKTRRIFKRARWLDQIFLLHVFDHPVRQRLTPARSTQVLPNPFFK